MKKWLYALLGILAMLLAGFVYAWSILSAPIAADFPQWSSASLSLTFTLCMTFFCLGGIASGILAKKFPAKINIRLGALLFATGFFISSRMTSLPVLYVSYGVLCGCASGLAYNAVMNIVPRWFPDKPGLISGLLLMGFGASSMVIGSLFTAITPDITGAWRRSLLLIGLVMAGILLAVSFLIKPPEASEVTGAKQPAAKSLAEYTSSQMLRHSSFWCLFLWAILLSAVGLIVIAQARNVVLTAANGLSAGTVSFIVGMISVCNGLGRVLFGFLFDKLGRKATMLLVTAANLLGVALIAVSLSGTLAFLVAGFIFIGFGYGGTPTFNAAVVKQFYGNTNYPVNFSLMNTNLLFASFSSAISAAMYDKAGNFTSILVLLVILIAVAFAISFIVRQPAEQS